MEVKVKIKVDNDTDDEGNNNNLVGGSDGHDNRSKNYHWIEINNCNNYYYNL